MSTPWSVTNKDKGIQGSMALGRGCGGTAVAGCVLVVGLLLSGPALAQREPKSQGLPQWLPLTRTHPEHRRELAPDSLPPPSPSMLPPPRLESRLVYRFPGPIRDYAGYDRPSAELCRSGAFKQQLDGFFYAATPERRFGVGFGNGANLYDLTGHRAEGMVYFFDFQDSGRCEVWVANLGQIANFARFK